jgi:PAS domain S-box-containing protein
MVPFYWASQLKLWRERNFKNNIELFFLLAGLVLVNGFIFNGYSVFSINHMPISYVPLAIIVMITYRQGLGGALLSIIITTVQAVIGTKQGWGPFISYDMNTSLLLVQTFNSAICGTILLLASAIHERSNTQQEISLNERRFRALVENSTDMISLLNIRGTITYSSPSQEKIMGFSKGEHEGHNIFRFIYPQDRKDIWKKFSHILIHPEKMITASVRVRHKDGSIRWIEGTGRNLLNDPAVGALVINYRDITDRKKTEEALKVNEARLRQIIDLVPHFIFAKDIDGRFILVNQAVADVYGTTVDKLIGRTDSDFASSKEEVRHFREDDLEVLRLGGPKIIPEEKITDSKGQIRYLSTTKIPFQASGVDKPCILGVSVDITELKKAEEILKNDLKQASRLADIGTLAAIIAHELRTPLGVIQMAVHNLKTKHKELATDKHVDNIQKKVWEGNRIIDNLLNYSKIKAPVINPCPILSLLEECLIIISRQFEDKNVSIERHYQVPHNFMIDADINQLREVFTNILINAYQAITGSDPKIILSVQKDNAEHLNIICRDTGAGIDPADLKNIFQPFFTTKAKGTGLGLVICNEIIALHHGRIDIESSKGVGTTVLISFPISHNISGNLFK